MGTSKIVIGAGVYVIIGLHALGFNAASRVRVTSVGTYNGYTVTIVAILQYNGVKWITQKVYQKPDAVEYSRLS